MKKYLLALAAFLTLPASALDVENTGGVSPNVKVLSNLSLPDGTAAAPSLRFTADTDVGLWRPGANQAALSTNGVERLRLGADGSVIVTDGGTLNADIAAGTKMVLVADGGFDGPHSVIVSTGANTASASLSFYKTRSVANTGDANTIVVSGDEAGSLSALAADGTTYLDLASITFAVDGTPWNQDMPGRIVFNTTADGAAELTERMRITQAGRVGIGTATPATLLHVQGSLEVTGASTFGSSITVNSSAIALVNSANALTSVGVGNGGSATEWYLGVNTDSDGLLGKPGGTTYLNFDSSPERLLTGIPLNVGGAFTVDSASATVEGNFRVSGAGSYAEFEVGTTTPTADTNFGRIWTVNNAGTAEVKVQDGAGNITQISPHNTKGEWIFDSQNPLTGKKVYINMEAFIRDMERLTGNRYIFEKEPER